MFPFASCSSFMRYVCSSVCLSIRNRIKGSYAYWKIGKKMLVYLAMVTEMSQNWRPQLNIEIGHKAVAMGAKWKAKAGAKVFKQLKYDMNIS